jgi:hypothetical protein
VVYVAYPDNRTNNRWFWDGLPSPEATEPPRSGPQYLGLLAPHGLAPAAGVHERERRTVSAYRAEEAGIPHKGGLPDETDHVLCEPPFDVGFEPEALAKRVARGEAVGAEKVAPVARPLLVEVAVPTLLRDGGREHHNRRDVRELLDKRHRVLRLKDVCHFQTESKIEVPIDIQRHPQVCDLEAGRRDEELLALDPGSVDSAKILYAMIREDAQPSAESAAHVDDTQWT